MLNTAHSNNVAWLQQSTHSTDVRVSVVNFPFTFRSHVYNCFLFPLSL